MEERNIYLWKTRGMQISFLPFSVFINNKGAVGICILEIHFKMNLSATL